MNKYTVTPINESSVCVEADSMELIDKQVTLFVGGQIKAHFPHIESVVVDYPPAVEPVPTLSAAGEMVALESRAFIEVGALSITFSGPVTVEGVTEAVRAQAMAAMPMQ